MRKGSKSTSDRSSCSFPRDGGRTRIAWAPSSNHPREVTADWAYLRFHGRGDVGGNPHRALSAAARRIERHLSDGVDVHVYFNNDAASHAVRKSETRAT